VILKEAPFNLAGIGPPRFGAEQAGDRSESIEEEKRCRRLLTAVLSPSSTPSAFDRPDEIGHYP
jgi:hypothetical protein